MKLALDPNSYTACAPFNEWLDNSYIDQNGELDILSFKPRPSEVLFTMSPQTYSISFPDFLREWEDELKRLVCDEFPSPIAYYFYRFENGYENQLQRLHLLRDTWESVIDLLHAVSVGEARLHAAPLPTTIKISDLLSDKNNDRLETTRKILAHFSSVMLSSESTKIITIDAIDKIKILNQTRNAFSHSPAQSEKQASDWITECWEDVLDVLDDLRGLSEVRLMRYLSHENATTIRCEAFRGHGATKTIKSVVLSADQLRDSTRFFSTGQMLVNLGAKILSARPFVHYKEDTTGHQTKICLFRKTRGNAPNRLITYSVAGDATQHDEPRPTVQPDIDELRALFGLGAE